MASDNFAPEKTVDDLAPAALRGQESQDEALAAIFAAMQQVKVNGMTVSDIVGGGDPVPIALHFADHLREHAGLAAGHAVLDIGCGCGRIAAALTRHILPPGRYIGVDIVPGLVDFANTHIAVRYPHFSFMTLDQGNPAYDGWRAAGASRVIGDLDEACAPASIDIGLATSLFTHLDAAMAAGVLRKLARALKPDGRALITAFLLDDCTRALIRRGGAMFSFAHAYGDGVYVQAPEIGLGAAAFEVSRFTALLAGAGLYVEKVLFGNWAGRASNATGQDLLIVRKL